MVSIIHQGPLSPMIKKSIAPPEQNFLFFDDMLDFEDLRYFARKEGEGGSEERCWNHHEDISKKHTNNW
jgi:hypothetical protein